MCDVYVHTCECRCAHTINNNVFISPCGGEATTVGISPCLPPCLRVQGIWCGFISHHPAGTLGCRHELLWLAGFCVFWGLNSGTHVCGAGVYLLDHLLSPMGSCSWEIFFITVSVSTSLSVMDLFRFLKPSSWFDF